MLPCSFPVEHVDVGIMLLPHLCLVPERVILDEQFFHFGFLGLFEPGLLHRMRFQLSL